jgi:hypothetical protein
MLAKLKIGRSTVTSSEENVPEGDRNLISKEESITIPDTTTPDTTIPDTTTPDTTIPDTTIPDTTTPTNVLQPFTAEPETVLLPEKKKENFFTNKWNKYLFSSENITNIENIFNIKIDNTDGETIAINDLTNENVNNEHNKYANQLQLYYNYEKNRDEENIIYSDEDEEKDITLIPVIKLTPFFCQKADNIMTTLLFMCLDQGHDFRDGSARTSVDDKGKKSWVDLEKSGKSENKLYFKKIDEESYGKSFENSDTKIDDSPCYSDGDFIKGLLNTTFCGGKNMFGLFVINDSTYTKLISNSNFKDENTNELNIQKLMEIVDIKFYTQNITSNLYFTTEGRKGLDGYDGGSIGKTIELNKQLGIDDEKDINSLLFLAFHERTFNDGMHSIWSFNEIKHIFLVRLDSLTVKKTQNIGFNTFRYELSNPQYSGKKILTLNQVIPEYTLDFKDFLDSEFLEFKQNNTTDKKLNASDFNNYILNDLSNENVEKLFKSFLNIIYNKDEVDANNRGTKYKFYGVQNIIKDKKLFPGKIRYGSIFIKLLQKFYQTLLPSIHPSYKTPNNEINEKILECNKLVQDNFEKLNDIKCESKSEESITNIEEQEKNEASEKSILPQQENENIYIIKQFGAITDTNIGNGTDPSTPAYIISYLNNTANINPTQNAGGEDDEVDDSKAIDYPTKFEIVSGALDSSSLGGLSTPDYHPPDLDVYMPIFDHEKNILKGIIVRITFLKNIITNPSATSSSQKSKTKVYCYFVYVSFNEIGIKDDISDNFNEYIKQLLDYVLNNTYYKDGTTDENDVNLKLKIGDIGDIGDNYKNWYKYYSDNQGPTVKESIVKPVSKNSVLDFIKAVEESCALSNNQIAKGILDVAQSLWNDDNNDELKTVFLQGIDLEDAEQEGQLLFLKLFLIRNKYTGDKARSTDVLFMNKSKYIEAIQTSNDENTLYNAEMFGLNTVWGTSSKNVFYIAPYYTYENKVSIIKPCWRDSLNIGLPRENISTSDSSVTASSKKSSRKASSSSSRTTVSTESAWLDIGSIAQEEKIKESLSDDSNRVNNGKIMAFISNFQEFIQKKNEFIDSATNELPNLMVNYNSVEENKKNSILKQIQKLGLKKLYIYLTTKNARPNIISISEQLSGIQDLIDKHNELKNLLKEYECDASDLDKFKNQIETAYKQATEALNSLGLINGGADADSDKETILVNSYRENTITTLKKYFEVIKKIRLNYGDFINNDSIDITKMDSIRKYCIALYLLTINTYFYSFTPKLSYDNLIKKLDKINYDTSIEESINIKNIYHEIFEKYMDIENIEYLNFMFDTNIDDEIVTDIKEYLKNCCDNIFNYITFMFNELNKSNLVDSEINEHYSYIINLYNVIIELNEDSLNNKLKLISLCFIEYCNEFSRYMIMTASNTEDKDNIKTYFDLNIIIEKIQIDKNMSFVNKLVHLNENKDLIEIFEQINNIVLEVENEDKSVEKEIEKTDLIDEDREKQMDKMNKQMASEKMQGFKLNPGVNYSKRNTFFKNPVMIYGGITAKNKKIKKHNKTKNHKKISKKKTIKRKGKKQKKHSKRT